MDPKMAIVSGYEEDQTDTMSSSSSHTPLKKSTFPATFDPQNPIRTVERVLDFLGKVTDFLEKETAEKEIFAVVKKAVEEKKRKKAADEAKVKAVEEKKRKKSAEEAKVKAESKRLKVEEEKMDEDEKKEESSKKVPNNGNGLDLEKYSWTQTLQEVNVQIPVPSGTKSRFDVCDIKKNHLKVGLKPPIIEEKELGHVPTPIEIYEETHIQTEDRKKGGEAIC